MNKKEFNKIVKASGRDFKIIEFGSGSEKTTLSTMEVS